MPMYAPTNADEFEAHGSRFTSFVRSARGASTLCAWRLDVPARLRGVAHRPSHEEVILVLEGRVDVTIGGERRSAEAGAVIHIPAASELRIDGGPDGASAWVTTTAGLTAVIGEEQMAPPWAQ